MLQQMKQACDQLPPHPGVALVCDLVPAQFAQLYRSEGRKAEADQQPSVKMGTPPELAKLDAVAERYEKDGLYPQAEATYRQAIAWAEANRRLPTGIVLGITSITQYYNRLGEVLEKQGLNQQAETTYLRAIELQEGATSEQPGSVYSFNFAPLLRFYRAHGRLSEIEPVVLNALELQERVLGPNAPRVADTLIQLAQIHKEEGQSDQARFSQSEMLYERAIQIEQINAGNDSSQMLGVLIPYVGLLGQCTRTQKLPKCRHISTQLRDKQVVRGINCALLDSSKPSNLTAAHMIQRSDPGSLIVFTYAPPPLTFSLDFLESTRVRRDDRAQYAGAVLRLLKSIESEGTQKYSLISARGSNSIVPVVVHGAVNTFGSMTVSENSSNP